MFAPIASNKNMQESNKNMEVMTRATKPQLFKYVTYEKINLMPPLKMGSATCQWTRGTLGNSDEPGPKNLSKTPISVE